MSTAVDIYFRFRYAGIRTSYE